MINIYNIGKLYLLPSCPRGECLIFQTCLFHIMASRSLQRAANLLWCGYIQNLPLKIDEKKAWADQLDSDNQYSQFLH